jgi:hypothetical protein
MLPEKSVFWREGMGFTMAEKLKIRSEYAKQYRKAKKTEKTKILDEYLKLLGGGNRKYAIVTLNQEGKKPLRFIDGKYVNVEITSKTRKKRAYKEHLNNWQLSSNPLQLARARPGSVAFTPSVPCIPQRGTMPGLSA